MRSVSYPVRGRIRAAPLISNKVAGGIAMTPDAEPEGPTGGGVSVSWMSIGLPSGPVTVTLGVVMAANAATSEDATINAVAMRFISNPYLQSFR
jgi:hypothetical protein